MQHHDLVASQYLKTSAEEIGAELEKAKAELASVDQVRARAEERVNIPALPHYFLYFCVSPGCA